jgi:hypothetical protein
MEPWLDSLSEDWDSQPRDSPSLPSKTPSLPSDDLSFASQQSRLPRSTKNSLGASKANRFLRTRSAKAAQGAEGAAAVLSEQSFSKLNVAAQHTWNKADSKSSRRSSLPRASSRAPSEASLGSVQHHTLQHPSSLRESVVRDGGAVGGETPEWKRRLIHGEGITKDQKDLFSPMGLESVFRPPTIGRKSDGRPKSENKKNPWAKLTESAQDPPSPDFGFPTSKRGSTMKRPEMEVLEEASEEGSVKNRSASAPELDREDESRNPAEEIDEQAPESAKPTNQATDDPRARTVSGQEELRNEAISPIIVSKTNTVDGTDYGAYSLSMRRLHNRLESVAIEQERPSSRLSDHEIDYGATADDDKLDTVADSNMQEWTSHSLPDDLSVGTPDIVSNTPFVNLRRGGYSRDNSFHRRNLSACSFPSSIQHSIVSQRDTSKDQRQHLESTMQSRTAAKIPPAAPTLPAVPSSPPVTQKTPSSGSPLKLFGKHDTFTNDKLMKRMNQYEETFEGNADGGGNELMMKLAVEKRNDARSSGIDVKFGDGQLDSYDFSQSANASTTDLKDDDDTGSPKLPRNVQHRETIFDLGTVESRETDKKRIVKIQRQSSAEIAQKIVRRSEMSRQVVSTVNTRQDQNNALAQQHVNVYPSEGKHVMSSPPKEPVAKRRRTLLTEDFDSLSNQLQSATMRDDKHIPTKSLAGQKRKDARYENDGRPADPHVLARRQILRPRNPTPGQAKSCLKQQKQQIAQNPQLSNEPELQSLVSHLDDVDTSGEQVDPKTEAVAEELATFGVGIAQMMSETRKGSITTQDFLNEATKIMDIIRAKGKPSPLNSVEESIVEESEDKAGQSFMETTVDGFSRPPSRDGASMRKIREPKELDPRVLSHLRRFQDQDDLELNMDPAQASLYLDRSDDQEGDIEQRDGIPTNGIVESSPSNIRIRDNPRSDRKRKHSASTVPDENVREQNEIPTHSSSGESTNRTIPTSSSTSSGLRGMIPSEKVSHLIPQQINGMTFDRATKRWIKNHRSSVKGSKLKGRGESSEDDPFRDIPDLSVDEMEELRRREAFTKADEQYRAGVSPHPLKGVETIEEQSDNASSGDLRPQTREGGPVIPPNSSSVPSKQSRFEFSVQQPGTRATSWGDEAVMLKVPAQPQSVAPGPVPTSHMDEVEHEIRIHEGRVSTVPSQERENRQPRAVTIAFSSPLVSHVVYQDEGSSIDNDSLLGSKLEGPAIEQFGRSSNSVQSLVHQYEQGSKSSSRRNNPSEGLRRMTLDGQPFATRLISRIEEQNEDTPEREMSVVHQPEEEKAVVTPARSKSNRSMVLVPSTKTSNRSFYLSPLPDFTVNQIDHSHHLEVSYIAGRMHHSSLRQVHGTFALAVEDMVKHITDVEPYEPYWEYLRKLNLKGKGLITLHRLREFCSRIEELDVSNNEIGQLADVPYSVRNLKIQKNCLSNLTSWGHLTNLQYLDVSRNELESLEGFGSLVHLRELRANGNKIRNIDGILDLDGLLVLKLSENRLTAVDFEACEL